MKLTFLIIIIISCIHSIFSWKLHATYNSTDFFDHFNFFSKKDPSGSIALYQNETSAKKKGLIQIKNKRVLIKADNKTVSTKGRDSIRIFSKESFNHGLFVIDLNHMPTGCGNWPAFWLVGNSWSKNGEIDIIEGVNKVEYNTISIHSNDKCIHCSAAKMTTATTVSCSDTKCTSRINDANSFGTGFNKNKGGVYVVQWVKQTSFQIWFFSRHSIPANLASGNTTQWPAPALSYHYGACNSSAFSDLAITLDLAFCGSWAGNSDCYKGCPSTCESFVKNTPSAFSDAYWDINYIKIYQ